MAYLYIFVISGLFLLVPSLQVAVMAGTAEPAPAISSPPVSPPAESAGATPASPSATGKDDATVADGASTSKPVPPKKKSGNRRWLIKQRDVARKVKPSKAVPIKWTSPQQQVRCEALLPKLRESFDKARYYSIQGDSCKTAAYASRFLEAYGTCDTQCPADYLKGLGYRDLIPRNMQLLVDLGQERCQDRPKAVEADASLEAAATSKPSTP